MLCFHERRGGSEVRHIPANNTLPCPRKDDAYDRDDRECGAGRQLFADQEAATFRTEVASRYFGLADGDTLQVATWGAVTACDLSVAAGAP